MEHDQEILETVIRIDERLANHLAQVEKDDLPTRVRKLEGRWKWVGGGVKWVTAAGAIGLAIWELISKITPFFTLIIFSMLFTACQLGPPIVFMPTPHAVTMTPDGSLSPTDRPGATLTYTSMPTSLSTPSASYTASPTETATSTPTATEGFSTPTRIWKPENLFCDPGFEWPYSAAYRGEGNTEWITIMPSAECWQPFSSAPPYTPELWQALRPCAPGQTQGCNNPDDDQKLAEFTHTILLYGDDGPTGPKNPGDIHGGIVAQQWFCAFATCRAGVFQAVETIPGATYRVGAWVRAWQNDDDDPASELDKPSDYEGAFWQIVVALDGNLFAFASSNVVCGEWHATGKEDMKFWDAYYLIECEFVANSSTTVVFVESWRVWPVPNNNSFIDDAYIYMEDN